MATHPIGRVFVELDMDVDRYTKAQRRLYKDATQTSLSIEDNFKKLGIKTSAHYDLMRAKITNAYQSIAHDAKATANDLVRAEQAKNTQLLKLQEEQYGKQVSMMTKLKDNWLATTVAITAAIVAMQKAWNMAEMAAQFEQSRSAFKSMVTSMGKDAEVEFDKIRKASAGLIDEKSLTESANKAISLGIPIEKLAALMEVARAKARDMGISTNQAFNDIATGVGRASPLILNNLGLVMKVGSANDAMAASLGKTVEQLTDQEKKMAVLNATLEAGKEAVNRYDLSIKTTKERMDTLKATVADLQLMMGQAFLRAIAGVTGAFRSLNSASMTASAAIWKLIQAKNEFMAMVTWGDIGKSYEEAAEQARQNAESDWKAALKYTDMANDSFGAMVATTDDLAVAMSKTSVEIKDNTETVTKNGKAVKETAENTEHLEKALEAIRIKLQQLEYIKAWEAQDLFDWVNAYPGVIDKLAKEVEDGINESVNSLKNADKEIIKDVGKTTDQVEKLWLKGLNRVQEGFADTFYDAMTGELDDLGDLFDSFFDDILRMVAELAAKMAMYDLFGVGTQGFFSSGSGSSGILGGLFGGSSGGSSTGGGSGMLSNLLSLAGTAYELIFEESFSQTLISLFPELAETLGASLSSTMTAEIGALVGGQVATTTATGVGIGASLGTAAQGGLAGIVAAAWAIGSQLFGEFLMRQGEGASSMGATATLGTSKKAGELFDLPSILNAWTTQGEWSDEDAQNALIRFSEELVGGLAVYETIFQNVSESSQASLKAAVEALDIEHLKIYYKQMAEEGSTNYFQLIKVFDEMTAEGQAALAEQLGETDWKAWWKTATDTLTGDNMLPEITFDDTRIQEIYDANRNISDWSLGLDSLGTEIAKILNSDYSTDVNASVAQVIADWIAKSYAGEEWIGQSGTAAKVLQSMLTGIFDDYISEALTNLGDEPVFEYMSDEFRSAFGELDLDLFLSDIDKFTEIFTETAMKINQAAAIWNKLENMGEGIKYTKADQLAEMAEAWGNAYQAIMTAAGTELSEEDLAAKVKAYYSALAEGTVDIDRAIQGVTDLDTAIGTLNGVFDAYIQQLEDLGMAVEEITELEEMRAAAMSRLLEDYKYSLGLISDEDYYTARIEKIMQAYGDYFASARDMISWFTTASLEDIQTIATALGLDWTDIANDVGWLVEALEALGKTAETVAVDIAAWQAALLGLEDDYTLDQLRTKYGISIDITEDWIDALKEWIGNMSADEFQALADLYGVSVSELMSDIDSLVAAFGNISTAVEEAEEAFQELADQIRANLANIRANISGGGSGSSAAGYLSQLQAYQTSVSSKVGTADFQLAMEDLLSMSELLGDWYDTALSELEAEASAAAEVLRDSLNADKEKAQAELAVANKFESLVDTIKSTILSIKYSGLNVGVPRAIAEQSWDDYYTLKTTAERTGTIEDYQAFVGFAQTYLQQQQEDLKSSAAYQAKYAEVMADLATAESYATAKSYDEAILAELERIDAAIEAISDAVSEFDLANLNSTFEGMATWIEGMVDNITNIKTIFEIDWGDYDATIAEALQALQDIVDMYGWDNEVTLTWISSFAQWLVDTKTIEDILTALGFIVEGTSWTSTATLTFISVTTAALAAKGEIENLAKLLGFIVAATGWTSTATLTFIRTFSASWDFSSLTEIYNLLAEVADPSGSGTWNVSVAAAFMLGLVDQYGGTLANAAAWLTSMGLTDALTAGIILNMAIQSGATSGLDTAAEIVAWAQGLGITSTSITSQLIVDLLGKKGLTSGLDSVADVNAWVASLGLTDINLSRTLSVTLTYNLVSSGKMTIAQLVDYIYNQLLSAWILPAKDAAAINAIKWTEGMAGMFGINSLSAFVAGMNASLNPDVSYADFYGVWQKHGVTPFGGAYEYGGIASGSERGYLATLHGTELVVSPKATYPATVVGGAQDGRPIEINLTLELDGKPLDAKITAIAKDTGENIRVKLVRWGQLNSPKRQSV